MQVITSIPTNYLPKCMTAGNVTPEQLEIIDRGDISTQQFNEELSEDMGQILWIRGLARLQNQVRLRFKSLSLQMFSFTALITLLDPARLKKKSNKTVCKSLFI